MASHASTTDSAGLGGDVERAALAGVLAGRDADQLVEEVITAWEELKHARESLAHSNQRNRVLELDLAEREDLGAPERGRLLELEEELRDRDSRIIHLERVADQANREKDELASSHSAVHIDRLEQEHAALQTETSEQGEVIAEMEGKIDQLVGALEKAAEAGLTSISVDEVRQLNRALDDAHRRMESGDVEAWTDLLVPVIDGENRPYEQYLSSLRFTNPRVDHLTKRKLSKAVNSMPWPLPNLIRHGLLKIRDFISLFL